ncbi:Crp/Fnr family transcriptional regulator [Staphylococcus capitis]|uniref:Crp/Fnr family transcriptional regulator n=1 Tax=Staphylococcus TaxID=1279 RepID=UPI00066DB51C|nr:Crp/Fnr family transcriptional regulator [Staphylococcus capitis]MBF2262699.1 Crp/Fnr family transcriptional regulator [Staphylococcus capitis]MBF2283335.1 Crp/Fnr family transcriptional regulator [Staphylococcus capitis]MBN6786072.1 Crp/Fnr family transcriptional regulator [Staphylococcus capitis]MBN6861150.1 Crp/Fnr family transcriptional regulator [Staphylococcus capitis]MDK8530431.1 Crp/Fnr family transcriptional regulator [Staphylococcus capitis]
MYEENIYIKNSEYEFDNDLKQLASYLNIPVSIIRPFKEDLTLYQYKKGQVICHSADQINFVYFLVNGCILHECSNITGDNYLRLYKDESMFPMNFIFYETPAPAPYEIYTALTDCKIITLPKNLSEFLCRKHKEIFESLFKKLNETIQFQIEYIMALRANSAKERIERILQILCLSIGDDNEEFYELKQIMTVQLISDLSGLNRKTTGEIIRELKMENIIYQDKKTWIIKK